MKESKIDILLKPINSFLKNEIVAGALLFMCAVIAMIWANSPLKESYHQLWETHFAISFGNFEISKTLHYWINDGLMSIFFFVVGLELKREIIGGELTTLKKAALPIGAALGGMLVPALIFIGLNPDSPASSGWGIPMATDIAFALGVLILLGKRVPVSIKLFLTALAIIDDLGAVLVIAFFYTSDISFMNLAIGGGFMATLIAANHLGVRNTLFYGIVGIGGVWLSFLLSGVHATIAGVLLAFAIPARTKIDELGFIKKLKEYTEWFEKSDRIDSRLITTKQLHIIQEIKTASMYAETPLQRLEEAMHPLVAFIVVPLFALANAGIELSGETFSSLLHPVTIGVVSGLVLGKFLGVTGFTFLLVKTKIAVLPPGVNWTHICGIALLAGIGFTMSLFISELAFTDPAMILHAKLGIMIASVIAAALGFVVLFIMGNKRNSFAENNKSDSKNN
jgi:NhaA family Na+:H+ antiporter